jgi:hypothetical protein
MGIFMPSPGAQGNIVKHMQAVLYAPDIDGCDNLLLKKSVAVAQPDTLK